jgi:hypothetical protein
MFSAGVVALQMGRLKGCSVAYGIPHKASGKNIFWDMKCAEHENEISFYRFKKTIWQSRNDVQSKKKLFQECEFVSIIRYVMLILTFRDYTLRIL